MNNLNETSSKFKNIPAEYDIFFGYPKEGPFVVKTTASVLRKHYSGHVPFHVFRCMQVIKHISLWDVKKMLESGVDPATIEPKKWTSYTDAYLLGKCVNDSGGMLCLSNIREVHHGRKVWALYSVKSSDMYYQARLAESLDQMLPNITLIRRFRRLPRQHIKDLEGWK